MTDDLLRKLRSGSNMVIPKGYIDAVPVHLRGDYHRFVEDITRMEKLMKESADEIEACQDDKKKLRVSHDKKHEMWEEAIQFRDMNAERSRYYEGEFNKCRIEVEKLEKRYEDLAAEHDECPYGGNED